MKRNWLALLFLLAILGLLLSSWQMYRLQAEAQNWGYWSLLLLLSGWLMLVLPGLRSGSVQRLRWMGLSISGGLLLWLGFPAMPLTPLLFVALIPFFALQREIEESEHPHKGRTLLWFAYLGLLLWNILTTFWVANANLGAGLFACAANSFLMCLPLWLWQQIRKVMHGSITRAAMVCFWLCFEYLHFRWELAWPWLTLGNGWAQYPALVQWYEYTGVLGGSLWILVSNLFLFRLCLFFFYKKSIKMRAVSLAMLLWIALPTAFSLYLYYSYEPNGSEQEVVVVQPNFEPHYERDRVSEQQVVAQVLGLLREAVTDQTRWVALPEATFQGIDLDRIGQNPRYRPLLNFCAEHPDLHLVVGVTGYRLLPADSSHPNRREYKNNNGQTTAYVSYNAALHLHHSVTDPVPVYFKSKLVAGAEFFPFRSYLSFLEPLLDPLGFSISGNGTQPERESFEGPGGGVGPIICYESVFGAFTTGYVRFGANALFILTNDGWWDLTPGHRQHLRFASLRAIETRRPIARAANTGISGFIDPRGVIRQATEYEQTAAIRSSLPFTTGYTFYTRWGDLIGRIASFAGVIFVLNIFVKNRTAD